MCGMELWEAYCISPSHTAKHTAAPVERSHMLTGKAIVVLWHFIWIHPCLCVDSVLSSCRCEFSGNSSFFRVYSQPAEVKLDLCVSCVLCPVTYWHPVHWEVAGLSPGLPQAHTGWKWVDECLNSSVNRPWRNGRTGTEHRLENEFLCLPTFGWPCSCSRRSGWCSVSRCSSLEQTNSQAD